MALAFDFRQELFGQWPVAQGYLVEQLDRLFAGLSAVQPLFSLVTVPPSSSVMATDSSGILAWIPQTQAIGASVTSINGDTTAAQTINAGSGLSVSNTGATHTITIAGNLLTPPYGGTGIANNAASTLAISGNFATTFTVSGTTSVTLPTSGTLVNSVVASLPSLGTVGTLTPTGGYNAVDGSAGISTTITSASLAGKTITVKNGLITGFA